jgi:hypothetical protein
MVCGIAAHEMEQANQFVTTFCDSYVALQKNVISLFRTSLLAFTVRRRPIWVPTRQYLNPPTFADARQSLVVRAPQHASHSRHYLPAMLSHPDLGPFF